ncbi:MAG: TPM domain-containing protein [Clostridiales bacterium]|nr:TPM domain-containing protein [Clostridiales bacterium]
MKKIFFTILVILTCILMIAPAALASDERNYVVDETGTLTNAQIEALNEKAAALWQKRACGMYIWIVDLVPEKYARTINDLELYADDFYARNSLGHGDDKNGMVLLLEIGDVAGERDYLLNTHGACTKVFNNSARERLLDDNIIPLFIAAFNNGNFYKVADTFFDQVEREFSQSIIKKRVIKLAIVILLPLLIALIVCSIWKSQMKTAKIARTADNYIPANGFNLTGQTDLFLYRTTTRKKIERSSSSGGSSSSSSGRSSGGKV